MNPTTKKKKKKPAKKKLNIFKWKNFIYQKLKEITFEQIITEIINEGYCEEVVFDIMTHLKEFGFESVDFIKYMTFAVQYPEWLIFMENKGFIEKTCESIKVGDTFVVEKHPYILANTDLCQVSLISLISGQQLSKTTVSNYLNITDFDDILNIFKLDDDNMDVQEVTELIEEYLSTKNSSVTIKI